MICERCHGDGKIVRLTRFTETLEDGITITGTDCEISPCPDCGGTGITHCCEGERPDCAAAPSESEAK